MIFLGDKLSKALKVKALTCRSYPYRQRSHPSGVALILVDGKGENSIAVASGANGNLSD